MATELKSILEEAMARRDSGRGLTNTQLGVLHRAEQGRPTSSLRMPPLSVLPPPSRARTDHYTGPNIPAEKIEGLKNAVKDALSVAGVTVGATNELHYNDATVTIDIDGAGIQLAEISSGNSVFIRFDGLIEITNGATANTLTIDPADITHDMAVREIGYYDSFVPKTIKVIASASY